MQDELWRAVPGHPKYEVSSLGRVRPSVLNTKTRAKGFLKQRTWGNGYLRVTLTTEGRLYYFSVARLVLEAFVGPAPSPDHQAAHGDGDTKNNVLANLRWATPKENCADKVRHGTIPQGERHPNATLSANAVRNIRKLSGMGFSTRDIADLTGRRLRQIENVVYGKSWRCVA